MCSQLALLKNDFDLALMYSEIVPRCRIHGLVILCGCFGSILEGTFTGTLCCTSERRGEKVQPFL